jgi:pilus assembly protein CpaE
MVPAVIISEDSNTQEILKLYLEEFGGYEFAGTDCYSDPKALAIVDVSQNTGAMLDLISKTECNVMAVSDKPSVDLVVNVMRAGAKEFISLPIIKNEFFEALAKMQSEKKQSRCKVLSIFSNKGGIGKTSIAANLALELAKITKENVALVDLNFQSGDITTFLDLKPSFNISYMLQNLDKINKDFLLTTLERYKDTSLYILADPPYFKQADDISPKQVSTLFEILKQTFSYIVVDTSAGFDAKAVMALDNSDMVFLTTIVNLPALRNCQRCLEFFDKLGYEREKVQVVVNRYMENDEITAGDIEKLLGRKIYWKIPNNYFTMMSAINKGLPVSVVSPGSNVAESYKDFALQTTDSIYRRDLSIK